MTPEIRKIKIKGIQFGDGIFCSSVENVRHAIQAIQATFLVSAKGKLQFWLSSFSVNGILAEIFVCMSMHCYWFG